MNNANTSTVFPNQKINSNKIPKFSKWYNKGNR